LLRLPSEISSIEESRRNMVVKQQKENGAPQKHSDSNLQPSWNLFPPRKKKKGPRAQAPWRSCNVALALLLERLFNFWARKFFPQHARSIVKLPKHPRNIRTINLSSS
jgi:hypothetical protein